MADGNDPSLEPPWTILKVLKWMAQYFSDKSVTESPRLDAELLIAHVLETERVKLYARYNQPLEDEELDELRGLIKRRLNREPIAYITGKKAFWSVDLEVSPDVLIPRSDTEVIVDRALDIIPEDEQQKLIDVGTGSGAISIALADERSNLEVLGTDISESALNIARSNAKRLQLDDRVRFENMNLLSDVPKKFHCAELIVSNPPYLTDDEIEQLPAHIRDYEPVEALSGGEDGLEVIRDLVPAAFSHLENDGVFLCEIGHQQGDTVQNLFEKAGFSDVQIHEDLGGRDRVVEGTKVSN